MAKIYKVTKEQYDALLEGKGINFNDVTYSYDDNAVYDVVDYAGIVYTLERNGDLIKLLGDGSVVSQIDISSVSKADYADTAGGSKGLVGRDGLSSYYLDNGELFFKVNSGSNHANYYLLSAGGFYREGGDATFQIGTKIPNSDQAVLEFNTSELPVFNSGLIINDDIESMTSDASRPTNVIGEGDDLDVTLYSTGISVFDNNNGNAYEYSYPAKSGTFAMTSDIPTIPSAGATATAVSTTASGGSATTWSKSDHIHSISLATGDNNGQVKIAGTNVSVKGLGTAAYTNSSSYASSSHTHSLSTLSDKTINYITEPNYYWNTPTITTAARVDRLRANRFAGGIHPSSIIVEKSIDAGATWTSAGLTDSQKVLLLSNTGFGVQLPKIDGNTSCNCMLRVTISGIEFNDTVKNASETERFALMTQENYLNNRVYASINNVYFWLCACADRIAIKVYASRGNSKDTWVQCGEHPTASGWSGMDTIKLSPEPTFAGGRDQTGNYWFVRFEFRTCASDGSFDDSKLNQSYRTSAQSISNIMAYGSSCWYAANPMGNIDRPYTYGGLSGNTYGQEIYNWCGDFVPNQNNTYALGTTSLKWAHLAATTVYTDNINRSSVGQLNFGSNVSEIQFQNSSIAKTSDIASGINAAFKTSALMANTTYTEKLRYKTSSTDVIFNLPVTKTAGTYTLITDKDVTTLDNLVLNSDLNTLVNEHEYRTTSTSLLRSLTNAPAACGSEGWAGEGNLIVKSFGIGNTGYLYQTFILKGGSRHAEYRRVQDGSGNWSSWEEIMMDGEACTINDLDDIFTE